MAARAIAPRDDHCAFVSWGAAIAHGAGVRQSRLARAADPASSSRETDANSALLFARNDQFQIDRVGHDLVREEASHSPASPCVRYRPTHLRAVGTLTP